jgi:hypothetical protein
LWNIVHENTRVSPTFAETGGSPSGPGKIQSMAISLGAGRVWAAAGPRRSARTSVDIAFLIVIAFVVVGREENDKIRIGVPRRLKNPVKF